MKQKMSSRTFKAKVGESMPGFKGQADSFVRGKSSW